MKRWKLVLASGLLVILGCQNDEIRKYSVSKEGQEQGERGTFRLVAAVFSLADEVWVFQMAGKVETVFQHKEPFDEFIRSVRFTGKGRNPVSWTLPGGWREEADAKGRYKTFVVGTKKQPLEVAVMQLGAPGKDTATLALANQWANLIGLKPLAQADLKKACKEIKVENVAVIVIELTGPGRTREERDPLTYTTPPGWKKTNPTKFSFLTFLVEEGDQSAVVSASVAQGSLLDNVNRWRDQVGLPSAEEAKLGEHLKKITIAGLDGHVMDFAGQDKTGKGDRILGAMVQKKDGTLFFKMMGAGELVGKQKPAFEDFLKSVRLNMQGQDP